MAPSPRPGHVRVGFDEGLWAEDLERASKRARGIARETRARLESHGQYLGALRRLEPAGPLGLPNCAKTYLPPPNGKWGMVFQAAVDEAGRPYLATWRSGCATRPRAPEAGASTSSPTSDYTAALLRGCAPEGGASSQASGRRTDRVRRSYPPASLPVRRPTASEREVGDGLPGSRRRGRAVVPAGVPTRA
jgi:hypothetical protein